MLNALKNEAKTLPYGLFILRVVSGLLMLSHGIPKLMEFSDKMQTFPDPIGLGSPVALSLTVFSEVICALFLVLGIKTRWVAIPLLITMLVASLVIHAADPLGKKELALLYAGIFASLFLTGGGAFQVRR